MRCFPVYIHHHFLRPRKLVQGRANYSSTLLQTPYAKEILTQTMDPATFYPGKRLSYASQLCTLRYHGPVTDTSGPWLGVEWDDPTRGKHNGAHNSHQYFTCLHPSPTCASFVRPTRKADPPRSFVEALKSKYASDDPDGGEEEGLEDPDVEIVFDLQKRGDGVGRKARREVKFSGKVAEEVGFDKIRRQLAQLSELRIIILDGLCMWRPEARGERWMAEGQASDVREACPKALELDLSRNLFEEWREVAGICEQLENLGSLRVEYVCFLLSPPPSAGNGVGC